MADKYIIEVRDANGALDFRAEDVKRLEHPYLFSQREFTIDNLCYYMSFGQDRNKPSGPMDLPAFMDSIGISYRKKYW
jgi:hypothetical protein